MRFLKSLLFTWVAVTVLFGCSSTTSLHFNKDMSGHLTTTYDFGDMIELIGATEKQNDIDSVFKLLRPEQMDEKTRLTLDSVTQVLETHGYENIQARFTDDYAIVYSFDFATLDVLNGKQWFNVLMELGDDADAEEYVGLLKSVNTFSYGKKWLEIDLIPGGSKTDSLLTDIVKDIEPEEMDSVRTVLAEMLYPFGNLPLTFELTFDRKIREVRSVLPFEQKKRAVRFDYTVLDLIDAKAKGKSNNIRIKLK